MTTQINLAALFAQHFGGAPELPTNDFDQLDGGRYRVSVDSVEIRSFKNVRGSKLTYSCTIVEGKSVGRKIWLDFIVDFDDVEAIKRGLRDLCAFVVGCGLDMNSVEVESMIGQYPVIELRYNLAKDKSRFYTNYYYLSGEKPLVLNNKYTPAPEEPTLASTAPTPTPAAQPTVATTPPWAQ